MEANMEKPKNLNRKTDKRWEELRERLQSNTDIVSIAYRPMMDILDIATIAMDKYLLNSLRNDIIEGNIYYNMHALYEKKLNLIKTFDVNCNDHSSRRLNTRLRTFIDNLKNTIPDLKIKYEIRPVISITSSEAMKYCHGGMPYSEQEYLDKKLSMIEDSRLSGSPDLICDIAKIITKSRIECGVKQKDIAEIGKNTKDSESVEWMPISLSLPTIVCLEQAYNKNYTVLTLGTILAVYGYELRFYTDFCPLRAEAADVKQELIGTAKSEAKEPDGSDSKPVSKRKKFLNMADMEEALTYEENFIAFKLQTSENVHFHAIGDWYSFLLYCLDRDFQGNLPGFLQMYNKRNWSFKQISDIIVDLTKLPKDSVKAKGKSFSLSHISSVVDRFGYTIHPNLIKIEGKEPDFTAKNETFYASAASHILKYINKEGGNSFVKDIFRVYLKMDLQWYTITRTPSRIPLKFTRRNKKGEEYDNMSLYSLSQFADWLGYDLRLTFREK